MCPQICRTWLSPPLSEKTNKNKKTAGFMAHEFTQLQLKDADLLALLKTSGDNEDNQLQEEEDLVH